MVEVNKKVAALEARLEAKLNETHQNISTTLKGIKEIVVAV